MNDLKFAIRQCVKNPGLTAVAVLTLALGIGANTAIYSILNAVWLCSLPVRDPHQLRLVNWSGLDVRLSNWTGGGHSPSPGGAQVHGAFPYPVYQDFKQEVKGCSEIFAFFALPGLTVMGSEEATTANALMVSGNFFAGYGAEVFMGRTLLPSDDASEFGPVVVITHRFWERVCGLDPEILGRTITLNQHSFSIVGVLPKTYAGPEIGDAASLYVPMSAQPLLAPGHPLGARNHWWVQIMARLEPGTDEDHLLPTMKGLFLQTISAPQQQTRMEQPQIMLQDGSRGLLGIRRMMALGISLILGAVSLVLAIACANLAGLLLARGSARQHEFSVRAALGAGRGRLIRQLMIECAVLSITGGVLGCVLAAWIQSVLLRFLPEMSGGLQLHLAMDVGVFLFALGAAGVTTLLSGLLPALRVTKVNLSDTLKSRVGIGSPSLKLGRALVVAQVSLSVLLVVGAGLLLRTLANLHRVELGFDPHGLLVFRVDPGPAGLAAEGRIQFYDQLQKSLQTLPGVQEVALSSASLLAGHRSATAFSRPTGEAGSHSPMADCLDVSEAFFQTMDIPILRGRAFRRTDAAVSPPVAVVNAAFAERFFGDEDPLGRRLRIGNKTDCPILGISGNAKYDRPQRPVEPTVYLFHRQASPGAMSLTLRAGMDPLSLGPGVREAVAELNPEIPVEQLSTQSQLLADSIMAERVLWALGMGLALLGIGLSGMGLYALLSFMVTRRRNDIGVRLALGARRQDVARAVVRQALRMAGVGLLIGVPIAVGLGQILRSVLFGVKPHDPLTLIAAGILVLTLSVLAAWIPARRAAGVDPMVALRME